MSKIFAAGCTMLFGALGVLVMLFLASEISNMSDPRASALLAVALLGLVLLCISLAFHGARVHDRFIRLNAAKRTQAESWISAAEHFCGMLLSASVLAIMIVLAVWRLIDFFSPTLSTLMLPQQALIGVIACLLFAVLGAFSSLVCIGAWNIFAAARRQMQRLSQKFST